MKTRQQHILFERCRNPFTHPWYVIYPIFTLMVALAAAAVRATNDGNTLIMHKVIPYTLCSPHFFVPMTIGYALEGTLNPRLGLIV